MRIAIWHDPPFGGARRALSELARAASVRHVVDVFATDAAATRVQENPHLTWHTLAFRPRPHRRGLAYFNDLATWRDRRDFQRLERDLAARINAENYDVALVSVLRNGQAPDALRLLRMPTAYYCHEPVRRLTEPWCRPDAAPLSRYERARQLWRWPTYTALERAVRQRDVHNVQTASLILTNSTYTADRIEAIYGRRAEVCWLGADPIRYQPPADRRRPEAATVLSVGALEPHKGFDFVIEAVGRVPVAHRPRLVIAGSGGHPEMPLVLNRLAKTAGVDLDLKLGASDAELAELYRSCDLFLFGAHFEPFGLVLLEAMASGLPVVAVREGGVADAVEDGVTGRLVPRDPGRFAGAVSDLLDDDATRAGMASAARAQIECKWTWAHAGGRLETHLERLAAPSPRPRA